MMGWRGCGVVDHADDRSNPIEWKFQSCVRPSVLVYDYRMGFIWCCKMGDYGQAAT